MGGFDANQFHIQIAYRHLRGIPLTKYLAPADAHEGLVRDYGDERVKAILLVVSNVPDGNYVEALAAAEAGDLGHRLRCIRIVHLFPNGQVERGTAKRPGDRPGFRWVNAYSAVTERGESQPLPRREWLAMARRDGLKCQFHPTKEAARKAAGKPMSQFRIYFDTDPTNYYSVSAITIKAAIQQARNAHKGLRGKSAGIVVKVENLGSLA